MYFASDAPARVHRESLAIRRTLGSIVLDLLARHMDYEVSVDLMGGLSYLGGARDDVVDGG